jgi:hypothetical protein
MEPSLKKETAIIEIQPESEYMTAQVVAHVENATEREIEFILAVQVPDSTGKLVIQEITQAGRPCRFKLAKDRVFVLPAEPGDEIEIKFVYTGGPRQDPDDFIRRDEIVLRMDGAWLPILPSSSVDFDMTIRHPSNYIFLVKVNGKDRKGSMKRGLRVDGHWDYRMDILCSELQNTPSRRQRSLIPKSSLRSGLETPIYLMSYPR